MRVDQDEQQQPVFVIHGRPVVGGVDLDHTQELYEISSNESFGKDEDVSYETMDVDNLLLGAFDDQVAECAPDRRRQTGTGRRRAMDLGYSRRSTSFSTHKALKEVVGIASGEASKVDGPPKHTFKATKQQQKQQQKQQRRRPRLAWKQLGLIGATALGVLASLMR